MVCLSTYSGQGWSFCVSFSTSSQKKLGGNERHWRPMWTMFWEKRKEELIPCFCCCHLINQAPFSGHSCLICSIYGSTAPIDTHTSWWSTKCASVQEQGSFSSLLSWATPPLTMLVTASGSTVSLEERSDTMQTVGCCSGQASAEFDTRPVCLCMHRCNLVSPTPWCVCIGNPHRFRITVAEYVIREHAAYCLFWNHVFACHLVCAQADDQTRKPRRVLLQEVKDLSLLVTCFVACGCCVHDRVVVCVGLFARLRAVVG